MFRAFSIAGGSSGVTLGGVLGFFLILLVGYGISSACAFCCARNLLSRFHLSRGLPELISSTLHYLLLLLVFFFAVNAGGVELNKFTVLTGALGVGVGFGLQNIVNNFVSGLILQFERPIHIGDVLDIDGTTGKVTRIGIRSSTVKTFQGAEVIIPNANFISGKVINWTLSESLRRVELAGRRRLRHRCEAGVQAARAGGHHARERADLAGAGGFLQGLRRQLAQLRAAVLGDAGEQRHEGEERGGARARCELLDEAGIEIPFPQRDLRLRSVDADAAAALLATNGSRGARRKAAGDEQRSRAVNRASGPSRREAVAGSARRSISPSRLRTSDFPHRCRPAIASNAQSVFSAQLTTHAASDLASRGACDLRRRRIRTFVHRHVRRRTGCGGDPEVSSP